MVRDILAAALVSSWDATINTVCLLDIMSDIDNVCVLMNHVISSCSGLLFATVWWPG